MQGLDAHIEAVRAVSRASYWSAEDAPLLPQFVAAQLKFWIVFDVCLQSLQLSSAGNLWRDFVQQLI